MTKRHKTFERYFLFAEVAKHLSFAKAAEKLDISRGYLSSQITALEKDLGVALLVRSTRSVNLTTNGSKLLDKMLQVDSELLTVEKDLSEDVTQFEGTIRITAPSMFGESFLPKVCHEFNLKHPGILFEIDLGSEAIALDQSQFDLAIRSTNELPDNMIAKELTRYRHLCCASPKFIDQFGVPDVPSELSNFACLMTSWEKNWRFFDGNNLIEAYPEGAIRSDNRVLLSKFALQGAGIVKAPEYLLYEYISDGRLVPILQNYTQALKPVFLIYPERNRRSVKINAFIKHLIDRFN